MARLRLHPQTGEGKVLLGILLLMLLELVVLTTTPVHERSMIGGVLLGAGTAAFILALAVLHHRHRARRRLPEIAKTDWFSADTVAGFPMEELRPLLLGPNAPNLNRLYTAWIMATHGHDAAWISHHLDLPPATAHLLVDAARRHGAVPGSPEHSKD
ncbi:hypothetical protein ACWC9T_27175 [Kitasatospora sp. NPDC001159]